MFSGKLRRWSLAGAALVVAFTAMAAVPAKAVTYTLQTGTFDPDGDDGPLPGTATGTFTFTSPTFITSPLDNVTLDSCSLTNAPGYSCTTATFYPNNNPFGGTDDYIGFNTETADGSGTGFLFFQHGALGANGVYTNLLYPQNTPGYGNFAFATLTVTGGPSVVPLPAALPLFATGLGALGFLARKRRKTQV